MQITYREIKAETGKRGIKAIESLEFFIESRDMFDKRNTKQSNNTILNKSAKLKNKEYKITTGV